MIEFKMTSEWYKAQAADEKEVNDVSTCSLSQCKFEGRCSIHFARFCECSPQMAFCSFHRSFECIIKNIKK